MNTDTPTASTTATVAMLFSDVEGSTRLLQDLGPGYAEVLLTHQRLLREAFDAHGGSVVRTEGDAFFVTFERSSDAVAAAVAGQRALHAHAWPDGVELRVRMGIHTGEVQSIAGELVGLAIHTAARIAAAGHGAQVLVSALTAELAGELKDGVRWLDLGEHRFKDLAAPVRVLQLGHPELPADFPAIRSQSGAGGNNLPAQLTAFIGRETEVDEVAELLTAARLITIIGAGGAGKTRLALRVAADQVPNFPDGVWFVDLAPTTDPLAVPQRFVDAMSLPHDAVGDLATAIGSRRLLFVVDNCEHLVGAVGDVLEALLGRCPGVSVLATSREPLGIYGEVTWRAPSLDAADALALFDARVRAADPTRALSDVERVTAATVCARLDNMPLAIELAAARVGTLSIGQVCDRLDERFRLLVGAGRGALARQRTLQATIDWSYDLLDSVEQRVLRWLGVFVGGFTLDAAEAICAFAGVEPSVALDVIDHLVAKSLVLAEPLDGAVRYRLLETIRQYALDQLLQAGETHAARDAHFGWIVSLAAAAEEPLWFGSPVYFDWLDRLSAESANLEAGFGWAVANHRLHEAATIVLQLGNWLLAGRQLEGVKWSGQLFDLPLADGDRAVIAMVAWWCEQNLDLADQERVELLAGYAEAIPPSRPWLVPMRDSYIAAFRTRWGTLTAEEGLAEGERAVEAARAMDVTAAVTIALHALGWTRRGAGGDLAGAHAAALEAAELCRTIGYPVGECRIAGELAWMELQRGDTAAAMRWGERSVDLARRLDDVTVQAGAVAVVAGALAARGEPDAGLGLMMQLLDSVESRTSVQRLASLHHAIAWYAVLARDATTAVLHSDRALAMIGSGIAARPDFLTTAAEACALAGDYAGAFARLQQARTFAYAEGEDLRAAILEGFAGICMATDQFGTAAMLLRAASDAPGLPPVIRTTTGTAQAASVRQQFRAARTAEVRRNLSVEEFERCWDRGAGLDFEAAMTLVDDLGP